MSRVPVLIAALLLLASGCSKPVSPVLPLGARRTGAGGALAPDPTDRGDAAGSSSWLVQLRFVGPTVTLGRDFQPIVDPNATFWIRSNGDISAPVDTVPAHSVLKQVRWHRAPGGAAGASGADGGEYFVDAPVFADGAARDSSQEFKPGLNILNLRVPARAGGGEITVLFWVDFPPGAWWAGPDPSLFPRSSDGDGSAVDVTDWSHFTTTPTWPPDGRRYFGPDSFQFVPSRRRPLDDAFQRRTFYELYGDRIYARSEGDTVHQGAWVAFCTGGYDRDSRYTPLVDPADPALPPGFGSFPDLYPVLLPQGFLGSPSAFRSLVHTKLANGNIVRQSETSSFPDYRPGSVFRAPHLAGYWRLSFPGKAYAVAIAVDAEGQIGRLQGDAVDIADRVDAGGGSPRDRLERLRILTFYVRPALPTGPADDAAATRGDRRAGRGQ